MHMNEGAWGGQRCKIASDWSGLKYISSHIDPQIHIIKNNRKSVKIFYLKCILTLKLICSISVDLM